MPIEHYPPPSYANYVWLAGNRLHLALRGHTIVIPLSQLETDQSWPEKHCGLHVLMQVLRTREREESGVRPAVKHYNSRGQLQPATLDDFDLGKQE
jgi:hypothetical protein